MKLNKEVARRYVPEKYKLLVRTTDKINRLQTLARLLGKEIVADIIDGWSTGNKVLDFTLVACNGVFDASVYLQYQRLSKLALWKANREIILVQKGIFNQAGEEFLLRNIYLATLRPDEVTFNIDKVSMSLPVRPNFLQWREMYSDGYLISGYRTVDEEWLTTGPLYNQYCDFGRTVHDKGVVVVPETAVCSFETSPISNKDELFFEHGIDDILWQELHTAWIRERTRTVLKQ